MRLSLPAPNFDQLGETLGRARYAIKRGFKLTDALFDLTGGLSSAIACAAVLRLPDATLLRITADITAPSAPPDVAAVRTFLLILVFGGLVVAAHSCRRLREWRLATRKGVEQ